MTSGAALLILNAPGFPATALGMDVHPLIRHEPDPDHPGWWSWDLRRRHALQRRDRQAAGPRRRAGAGGLPDVSGGAPFQSRRHGPWRGDPDLHRHGLVRRRAAGRGECDAGGDARLQRRASSRRGRIGVPLDAEVELLRETKRLAFFAGKVVQEGELVASFSGALRKAGRAAMTALAERYRALVAAGELTPRSATRNRRWRCSTGWPRQLGETPAAGASRPVRPAEAAARRRLSVGRGRARQIDADGPRLRDDRPSSPSAGSISTNSCSRCTSGCAPSGRRRRAIRSRRSRGRSPPRRNCSASTRW